MTNGPQSAGPLAAQTAIANSLHGSAEQPYQIMDDGPESIKEEDEEGGDESDVEQVAKSIGVMKMDNNKTIFASEQHWYAILGEVCGSVLSYSCGADSSDR